MEQYTKTSYNISRLVTQKYSTSFSIATSLFKKESRDAIYSIYGFVRFADEIVDSFHGFDKQTLIERFEKDYYTAHKEDISLNPILHSFQRTVKKYDISDEHIQAFLKSMKADLVQQEYTNKAAADEYIYGSADVVGLMCLKVFCNGNDALYKELEHPAKKLGSAFQKVNFLRDLKNDVEILQRCYFSEINNKKFDDKNKKIVVEDIENDFQTAMTGIKRLPNRSKLAVLIAYLYYRSLLKKIDKTPATRILETRIRVSNFKKMMLLAKAMFIYKLRLI